MQSLRPNVTTPARSVKRATPFSSAVPASVSTARHNRAFINLPRALRDEAAMSRRELGMATVAIVAGLLTPTQAIAADPTAADYDGIATFMNEKDIGNLTPTQRQLLSLNRRIQTQNRAKAGFPGFIREGFNVLVVGDDGYVVTADGLIYKDFKEGTGDLPQEGQEVVFHYTGYNESASQIDSSYKNGRPSQTQLGVPGLIPGFAEGLSTMRVGTQRRIIVPPALGPPVGPSTFFSAKQCEVFDVEVLALRSCKRETVGMFSKVVCYDQ